MRRRRQKVEEVVFDIFAPTYALVTDTADAIKHL